MLDSSGHVCLTDLGLVHIMRPSRRRRSSQVRKQELATFVHTRFFFFFSFPTTKLNGLFVYLTLLCDNKTPVYLLPVCTSRALWNKVVLSHPTLAEAAAAHLPLRVRHWDWDWDWDWNPNNDSQPLQRSRRIVVVAAAAAVVVVVVVARK